MYIFEVAELNPGAAEEAYFSLLNGSERTDEVALKVKEEAVYRLAKLHVVGRQVDKVLGLLQNANPLFAVIPKVLNFLNSFQFQNIENSFP